ncbi:MAG: class I SAM-dependent methyltransferase [Gemmatimonadota bacterium]
METPARCRFCQHPLRNTFVDLGKSPLCESYLKREELNQMEPFFPLRVWVCESCLLVQLEQYVGSETIFRDYAYFSSYSDSWLAHAQAYADLAVERFELDSNSYVVEIGSNDGYLLKNFVERGIPCLGVDPARNVAAAAEKKGVPTLTEFFGRELGQRLATEGPRPSLLIGNNVLAQVPDLNDFVAGVATLLAPEGVATFEFPHLLRLVEQTQFDTIYHEHFSYFSLLSARTVFSRHGLLVFDVDEIPTHGGSLRIYVRHAQDGSKPVQGKVAELVSREEREGLRDMGYYGSFCVKVEAVKRRLLRFLIDAKEEGKSVVGYGAPGKGNTLLNYCGIRTDLLAYTVDRNPFKQGMFTPGTHIPIFHPDHVGKTRPDYLLILPWNLKEEIMNQMAHIRDWGARFVIPVPDTEVFE